MPTDPSIPESRLCGCTADTELAAGPVCTVCGHRDHSSDGCRAVSCRAVISIGRSIPESPETLSDPDKLRLLATWFDDFDDWREKTGKLALGISEYRDIQRDLRRIADELDRERASRVTQPTVAALGRLAGEACESEGHITLDATEDMATRVGQRLHAALAALPVQEATPDTNTRRGVVI